MRKNSLILVTGGSGLVGGALRRALKRAGYARVWAPTRRQLDLSDRAAVERAFKARRPEYVFQAAARVGGIAANAARPADFIYENLAIQTNVLHAAHQNGVKRLLFFTSSCVYPKLAKTPIREDSLLTGPIEPTNEPYAVAKIAGLKMCQALRKQYGAEFFTVVPANLYGPGDHFDESGHVVAGLLKRFSDAKARQLPKVEIWGSGKPRRDFLYIDDAAEAALLLMASPRPPAHDVINVGSGRETSIAQLALMIKRVAGYKGKVVFDTSRPDGIPRRLLDNHRIAALGWKPRTGLESGLRRAYASLRRG